GSALLYPGPLWRGGRVQESPQDGPQGCGPVFRRYRDVPSENPVTRPRTRRARHRGAVSLWFLSLWARKEKGTRPPAGGRNRFVACDEFTSSKEISHSAASTRPHPDPLRRSSRQGHPWPFPASRRGEGEKRVSAAATPSGC